MYEIAHACASFSFEAVIESNLDLLSHIQGLPQAFLLPFKLVHVSSNVSLEALISIEGLLVRQLNRLNLIPFFEKTLALPTLSSKPPRPICEHNIK